MSEESRTLDNPTNSYMGRRGFLTLTAGVASTVGVYATSANAALTEDSFPRRLTWLKTGDQDPEAYDRSIDEGYKLDTEASEKSELSKRLIGETEYNFFLNSNIEKYNKFISEYGSMNLSSVRRQCLYIGGWQRGLNNIEGVNLKVDGVLGPLTLEQVYIHIYSKHLELLLDFQKSRWQAFQESEDSNVFHISFLQSLKNSEKVSK